MAVSLSVHALNAIVLRGKAKNEQRALIQRKSTYMIKQGEVSNVEGQDQDEVRNQRKCLSSQFPFMFHCLLYVSVLFTHH